MPTAPESTSARKSLVEDHGTPSTHGPLDAGLIAAVGGGAALHELSITRFFDAPRELVYEAYTNPHHARQWAGPRGFTATHFEGDARPGGKWRACLHQTAPWQGHTGLPDLWQGGVFKEVVPPERLVYTFAWEGQGGQPTRETVITIRFTEVDGNRTKMDFHQEFFDTVEMRDGHNTGWNSSFDRLNDYVQENLKQL
ncbi:MAG TPA: SRPBCC domain-containing protein, partial [Acidobacteriaceae bacterium]|nr:SRPBCC domain-containing protein [Acidobacteriaceae bacterium]